MCKVPIEENVFVSNMRYPYSRRSQVFSVRSVTHLEDISSSKHTPGIYTFLRDLCKRTTEQVGNVCAMSCAVFSFLASVTEQTSKTLQEQQ